MRYSSGPRADNLEPRRTELHNWANAWTAEIAEAAGGLEISGWHRVRSIVHELRKRAAVGDLSYPEQPSTPQAELSLTES